MSGLSIGFAYGLFKHTNVDVRLDTVDDHEYVIASSENSISCDGGLGVVITHHVGCKKCNLKADKTIEAVETSCLEERN